MRKSSSSSSFFIIKIVIKSQKLIGEIIQLFIRQSLNIPEKEFGPCVNALIVEEITDIIIGKNMNVENVEHNIQLLSGWECSELRARDTPLCHSILGNCIYFILDK